MTGYLTTHVLDTARGCPAEGIKIALYKVSGESHEKIAETVTNADGRTDSPILLKQRHLRPEPMSWSSFAVTICARRVRRGMRRCFSIRCRSGLA